jgi:hypothetical protein
MGSTLLMRKGSIRVLGMCAPGLSWSEAQSYHRKKPCGVGYFQRHGKLSERHHYKSIFGKKWH